MYLIVFNNPHDNYKELKLPFWAENDTHAQIKVSNILDIWFDENEDYIKGSITNGSVRLFNMKEVKIDVPN